MTQRAVRDPAVILAWSQTIAAYQRPLRRTKPALFASGLASGALGIAFGIPALVVLGFVLIGASIIAMTITLAMEREDLPCPHCGRCPAPAFSQLSPVDAEFCAHCHYWLRPPF